MGEYGIEQPVTSPGDLWSGFTHDPRDPGNVPLRAADQDRNVVHQLLAEAYADGRLDREEFDLRTEQTGAARTLGELPSIVGDLLPSTGAGLVAATTGRQGLRHLAEQKYRSDVSDALRSFLFSSIVCLAIWAATMYGEFFWPGIVMAVTGARVIGAAVGRQSTIDAEVRRLEKKQDRDRARELAEKPGDRAGDDPGKVPAEDDE